MFIFHTLWEGGRKLPLSWMGGRGSISWLGGRKYFLIGWKWKNVPHFDTRLFFSPVIFLKANSVAICSSLVKTLCLVEVSAGQRRASDTHEMLTWLSQQVGGHLTSKPADVIQSRKRPSHTALVIDSDGLLCQPKWFWNRENCCHLKNFRKSRQPRPHLPRPPLHTDTQASEGKKSSWNAGQQNPPWLP